MVSQNVDDASFSSESRWFFQHVVEHELATFNHFDVMAMIPANRLSHEVPQLFANSQH